MKKTTAPVSGLWHYAPCRRIPDSFNLYSYLPICIIHTYTSNHKWDQRPDGVDREPGKRCCPWVNEWQFTSVVVAAAVELCELCDYVEMRGNGGGKWIVPERIALRSPPHRSQPKPLGAKRCSVTRAHCCLIVPSVISVAAARATKKHATFGCATAGKVWIKCKLRRLHRFKCGAQCSDTFVEIVTIEENRPTANVGN